MYQAIAIGLGFLVLATAIALLALGDAMRKDKLPPNSWAGIRTKAAFNSKSEWYRIQRAGSLPIIGLGIAYADSSILFVLQGIYYETISASIPITVLTVQSIIGIIWTYRATQNTHTQDASKQEL